MDMLKVDLLGKFEIKHGNKAISISSRPAQSLFAYLILSAGTPHRREKLAGLLWPDSLEETARDNLRHALWRLRKAFPSNPKTEYLLADDLSIAFNASADYWLDADALEKLSESASANELIAVLSEYQGELLPGFYDEWAVLEREHLFSIFEHHMARLMSLLQDEKRWLDILDWGERWIKLGQKPEPAYRALMSAHAAKGDMSKVAATYERCVRSLRELGIEPSQQTRELFENLKLGKETLNTIFVSTKTVTKQNISSSLPTGIVTFLFTDIEGSTKLAQAYSEKWENLRSRHHTVLRNAVESNNGFLFQIIGDAFCVAFHTVKDGFQAALDAQRKLQAENWGKTPIKVRMGLHTGAAEINSNDYLGYMTLVRVQRVMSAAHGGQILVSNASAELLRGELQGEITLRDMKEYLLKDLPKPERLWQIVASDIQQDFPPLQSLMAVQNNLPVPLTSFVGREKAVEEVVKLAGGHRLVTLTGPGGVGKTRLTIQSSNKLFSNFKDGVWWVELAPLTDEALVAQAIAKALGVREFPNQPLNETLSNFLLSKQLLLVLDNCEHLIAGCAYLVDTLLSACPNLKILATSREALGLTGEEVWSVPILSLPSPQSMSLSDLLMQYEGIRLFVERASAARSDFTLTERNASSVTQVCQRLDGMPLAIELAAARVRMMSVSEIAKRLDDRFNLLTVGSRTALPRHQTLRAAIDWSYDLLSEPERIFFSRLSIFAGGFTLEAAEEVGAGGNVSPQAQVVDLLGQLIYKSLVIVETFSEDSKSETRYGMLETIREYAREKLGESGEMKQLRQWHRDYFIALAERAEPKLKGREQFEWLDQLELEHDNLRAAWNCAIETDADLALRLVSVLLDFWLTRGNLSEGREWMAILLEQTKQWGQAARRAHALSMAGQLTYFQSDFYAARTLLEQALPVARASGDQKEVAFALLWLGRTIMRQRDDQIAQSFLEEALALYQELQDEFGIERAGMHLAELAATQGSYGKAEELYMKILAKYRDLGDGIEVQNVLNQLGELARLEGDYERAGAFYEKALDILRGPRSRFSQSSLPLFNLAWVWLHRGNHEKANTLFQESLELTKAYDDNVGTLLCVGGFAAILGMIGKPEQGARLFGALESLLESSGLTGRLEALDQKEIDHYVAVVRSQLDEPSFAKAWAEGSAMTFEQAIEFALKETMP